MSSKMRQYDRNFLRELLIPLVRQWGREAVIGALHDIEENGESYNRDGWASHERRESISDRKGSQSAQKASAVMIAEKADVPNEKRMLLITLASKFEHKSFLPTISDVRNFLEMRGEDARSVKQRPEAFRRIIKAVIDLPTENLEQMIRSSRHSGPSQLGPLSDAIKAASAAVRPVGTETIADDSASKPAQSSLPLQENEKGDVDSSETSGAQLNSTMDQNATPASDGIDNDVAVNQKSSKSHRDRTHRKASTRYSK